MPLTLPQTNVFGLVSAEVELKTGVKSFFGYEHLHRNAAPPRYVWQPTAGTASFDLQAIADDDGEAFAVIDYTFAIHCWHTTHDGAFVMMVALLRAMREVFTDPGGLKFGTIDPYPDDVPELGQVIVIPVVVSIPILDPEWDATWTKVTIAAVALDSSAGVDPGLPLIAPLK